MEFCSTPIQLFQFFLRPEDLSLDCFNVLSSPAVIPEFATYIRLFLLTCLLEAPIYFLSVRTLTKLTWLEICATLVGVNLATHPFVNFVLPKILEFFAEVPSYGLHVTTAELIAPIVEAALLMYFAKVKWQWVIPTAVAANLCSWLGYMFF